jgi:L-ascorbate metabolism protein UlaG (beta-lactamase superfamily)
MRITWWGHATSTLELGDVRVLTDPVLTNRIAHLARHESAAPAADAARADIAIVSHLHADHLHLPSLRMLPADTRLVAPAGSARLLARAAPELAERVEEVDVGDSVRVGDVQITAVPAHHDGRRHGVSRFRGPALGFVLRRGTVSVWFAGDTGLFDGLEAIGPVDVAVVPVGGWGPTLGPHHLDPEQAAEAVDRVGARDAVPVHYGTFWPTGLRHMSGHQFEHKFRRPGDRFADALRASGSEASAHVLRPGATVQLG